jgi:hypothetical protein
LLDKDGNDIFGSAFNYLCKDDADEQRVYADILRRLFNSTTGGQLILERIKGDSAKWRYALAMPSNPLA